MSMFEMFKHIGWQPHIGDPTLFGWLTVIAYLVAAVASGICARRADEIFEDEHVWQHRLIWGGMSVGLLFLGFNKQLDLQTLFTAVIQEIAWQNGVYAWGQQAQIIFIAGLALISFIILIVIAWAFRHVWRHYWLLLLGVLFIARFIIVRAATFYHVPLPELSRFTGGFRITWMLELVGALVIALAAYLNIRRGQKREGSDA